MHREFERYGVPGVLRTAPLGELARCTPRPSCWVNNLHELGHMSISTLRINGDPVLFCVNSISTVPLLVNNFDRFHQRSGRMKFVNKMRVSERGEHSIRRIEINSHRLGSARTPAQQKLHRCLENLR